MNIQPKKTELQRLIQYLILFVFMLMNIAIWGVIVSTIFFITTHLMAVDKFELKEFNKNPEETLRLVGSIFGILFTAGILSIYFLIQQLNQIKKIL